MDSMDYQMEGMPGVHFEAPFQVRRCPYARNPHITPNSSAFVPSLHYSTQQSQAAWTAYPYLPPPMPSTHMSYHNTFAHPPIDNSFSGFPRGLREQVSTQHTPMADNAETGSNSSGSWQSNPFEGMPQVQAEAAEGWRPNAASSNANMTALNGTYNGSNTGPHDRSLNSNVLPPLSTLDRSTRSTSYREADGNFTPTSTSSVPSLERRLPRDLSRWGPTYGEPSRHPPRARPAAVVRSLNNSDTPSANLLQFESVSESSNSPNPPAEDVEDIQSLFSVHGRDLEAFLDRIVPPLENESSMRMDDPALLDHQSHRMHVLQTILDRERSLTKKPGASKTALNSLVKISIKDLEEDNRTCQICYNDYGVENPEGEIEYPLQLPKCKHSFGENCLKRWLEEKSTCPYCRDQLPSDPQKIRRVYSEFRRPPGERQRHMAHALTRQAMRHGVHLGRNSTESSEQNSTRDEARAERRDLLEELALDDMERNFLDTPNTSFASQTRSAMLHPPPSYGNQNSSASRRTRGRVNNSRESGSGRESHQSDNRHLAATLQPLITANLQQMPMRTPITSAPYAGGNESMNGFYMGTNSNGRVGTYSGDARLSTAPSFPEVEFPSAHPHSQNNIGGFPSYGQSITPAQHNSSFNHRDITRQDRNYRPFTEHSWPYGRFVPGLGMDTSHPMHLGFNHNADTLRNRDNPPSLARNFLPGPQALPFFGREPNPQATDADLGDRARTRPDYSADQRATPQDETNSLPYWRQSHEARYSSSSSHDTSRDHNVLVNPSAGSQVQPSQEQTILSFPLRSPGEHSDESLASSIPPPSGTHSNPELEYQNFINENIDSDYLADGIYDDPWQN